MVKDRKTPYRPSNLGTGQRAVLVRSVLNRIVTMSAYAVVSKDLELVLAPGEQIERRQAFWRAAAGSAVDEPCS